jgi:AraC-like DNA-binding protein
MRPDVKFIGTGFSAHYGKFNIQVSHAVTLIWNAIPTNRPHMHTEEYEFNLVLAGSGEYHHRDKVYALSAGDVFISVPYVPHEISSIATRDLHVLWLNVYIKAFDTAITDRYEDRLLAEFMRGHQTYLPGQKFLLDYPRLLSGTTSTTSARNFSTQHLIQALFFDFLELANNTKLDFNDPDVNIDFKPFTVLNLASNFIMANLHIDLAVATIADAVCTSERNLRHLFRKHLNTTVVDYINKKKMEQAGHLLSLQLQVQEVSSAVGSASPSQFSRLFKRYQGLSPRQYKERLDRTFVRTSYADH